jgi:magnesium transporter
MPYKLQDYPAEDSFTPNELREAWLLLLNSERAEFFKQLPHEEAGEFFFSLQAKEQQELLLAFKLTERRTWMRLLDPDDAADVIQEAPPEERDGLLALLDEPTRKEVLALLAYAEDEAGGLMNPRYARVRPDMTVDEAISYLRKQARERVETIYYAYVLDAQQHLLGVVSFRELFSAQADKKIRDVMRTDIVSVPDNMDQEAVSHVLAQYDLMAIPVVDSEGRMKGIVTADDIVDVVQEVATEDIHKMGGMEALDEPYLRVNLWSMIKKRGGWLSALFLGEMLTATAMGYFEHEISKAVVLALFVPLIISSGGNSGSQATTLVIRAMALGEVRLRDWWRVLYREFLAGIALGLILGVVGLMRILLWPSRETVYGEYYSMVGLTVALSLIGVVLLGTLAGSGLPFILRRLGLDPASASAPFVATIVDVTGLLIYFTIASLLLSGTLL